VLALAALSGAIHFLHVHVTGQLFILERRFRYAALVDGIEVVATTAGSALGLASHGLVGAVAGAAAGSAVAAAVSLVLAMGPLGLRLPLADLGRVAIATAVMALGLGLLPPLGGIAGLAATVSAGGALYAAVLALLYARRIGAVLHERRSRGPATAR
jgi:O-antigen/teichoic acid export membrane protein